MNKAVLLFVAALSTVCACSARSIIVERPRDPVVNRAVTALWVDEVTRVAQTGDWILTRSYSLIGDVIVIGTVGESVSHGAIYDAERGTIIEAITPAVREVPLESLMNRNQLVIVVRPGNTTEAQRKRSAQRARKQVGAPFDFGGLIGIQSDDRFYCSELVYWASDLKYRDRPRVLSPSDLMQYGEVVYVSGSRDTAQVQNIAMARHGFSARFAVSTR